MLVCDSRNASSVRLTSAALRSARGAGAEVVAVIEVGRGRPTRRVLPTTLAARAVRRVTEPNGALVSFETRPLVATCARLARLHRVPVVRSSGARLNDPVFVERVRAELRPDGTLALMVGDIFEPPLLAACRAPANYHNGLLPAYRGIGATGWSLYEGARRSGFSYHRMTEQVDAGPLLAQGAIEVADEASGAAVERAKTELAAAAMPEALDRLVEGDPGDPQQGPSSTYTRADLRAIRTVPDPSALTWDDLRRRLRAFELISLRLGGRDWPVTSLRRRAASAQLGELGFTTADGVECEPSRFVHLPLPAYRAWRRLGAPR